MVSNSYIQPSNLSSALRSSLPCSRPDQTTFLPQGLASIRLPGGCFLKKILSFKWKQTLDNLWVSKLLAKLVFIFIFPLSLHYWYRRQCSPHFIHLPAPIFSSQRYIFFSFKISYFESSVLDPNSLVATFSIYKIEQ